MRFLRHVMIYPVENDERMRTLAWIPLLRILKLETRKWSWSTPRNVPQLDTKFVGFEIRAETIFRNVCRQFKFCLSCARSWNQSCDENGAQKRKYGSENDTESAMVVHSEKQKFVY